MGCILVLYNSISWFSAFLVIFHYHIPPSSSNQTPLVINDVYIFQLKPSRGSKTSSIPVKISLLPMFVLSSWPLLSLVQIMKQDKEERKGNPICNKDMGLHFMTTKTSLFQIETSWQRISGKFMLGASLDFVTRLFLSAVWAIMLLL